MWATCVRAGLTPAARQQQGQVSQDAESERDVAGGSSTFPPLQQPRPHRDHARKMISLKPTPESFATGSTRPIPTARNAGKTESPGQVTNKEVGEPLGCKHAR
jgi:hypothetical protein